MPYPDATNAPNSSVMHEGLLDRIGIPRPLLMGFVGLLIFMIGDGVELGYLAPYLREQGIDRSSTALLFTLYGITVAIASWLAGALSNLWGPRRVMWLGIAIWAIFELAFLVLALGPGDYRMMLVTYTLRGFGYPLFAYGFLVWIAAATPSRKLGLAVSWFWVAYAAGLPTLGSLVASFSIPVIGALMTFWLSFGLVIAGGMIAMLGLRGVAGGQRLAPKGERPLASLAASISIMWREPKSSVGGVVRIINTAAMYAFFIVMPGFFIRQIGFTLPEWLQLLTIVFLGNILGNLIAGALGNRFGYRATIITMGALGSAITTPLFYYVPQLFPGSILISSLVGFAWGVTLSGYVPLSALMPTLIPHNKAGALSVLSLGAGAATWVGPAIVTIFVGTVGLAGIVWIFSGLYAASAILVLMLRETAESG